MSFKGSCLIDSSLPVIGKRFKRSSLVVCSELDGQIALFQSSTCDYLVLNETGSAIWAALESALPLEQICEKLLAEYEVTPEQCQMGVEEWLSVAIMKEIVVCID